MAILSCSSFKILMNENARAYFMGYIGISNIDNLNKIKISKKELNKLEADDIFFIIDQLFIEEEWEHEK